MCNIVGETLNRSCSDREFSCVDLFIVLVHVFALNQMCPEKAEHDITISNRPTSR